MTFHSRTPFLAFAILLSLTSCESEVERQAREALEEQARIEAEAERLRLEEERRIAEEARRRQQAIWNEYSENSLARGAKPWGQLLRSVEFVQWKWVL